MNKKNIYLSNIMKLINYILDFIHLLIIFNPIIIYYLYKKNINLNVVIKFILIINILIPIHWQLCNNKCLLSELSKYLGAFDNNKDLKNNNNNFSKKYLNWLYQPILKAINCTKKGICDDKLITFHWIINIIIIWYLTFFKILKLK